MRLKLTLVVVCALSVSAHAQVLDSFKSHVQYLASDELQGRGTGSDDIRRAAEYIASHFESIGLQPIADASYYQDFPIPGQRQMESNVVGIIPAATASTRSLVFTAYYDAYGVRPVEGSTDSIHNGAQDNAIGVAALIELARLFKADAAPTQNLVFVATAAEEGGMHGSRFYVEHPAFPLGDIPICLNIDGFNISGPREDYFVMPRQGVGFLDEIELVAANLGWYYESPEWVDGMNRSFDTASFLAAGIPAFTLWTGSRLKGGETAQQAELGRIHTPDDEITDKWNWDGVEDHIELYRAIAGHFLSHPDGLSVTNPDLFVVDR